MMSATDGASGVTSHADPDGLKGLAMDWDDALPWALLLFLAPFAMAIRSIVVDHRRKAQIEALTGKVAMLDHRMFRLDERLTALAGGAPDVTASAIPEAPTLETPPAAAPVPAPPVAAPNPAQAAMPTPATKPRFERSK